MGGGERGKPSQGLHSLEHKQGARLSCLFEQSGHPGFLAMAGTWAWAAKGVFTSQREVLLEPPCWLDGGCEQVRRGYLYGQLCCIGGCGRSDWWAGPEFVMGVVLGPGTAPPPRSGNTWGGRQGCLAQGQVFLWRRGMVSGRVRGFSGSGALAVGKIPRAELAWRVGLGAVPLVRSTAFEVLLQCACASS